MEGHTLAYKVCKDCGERKHLTEFNKGPRGHQYYCRSCQGKRTAISNAANRERMRDYIMERGGRCECCGEKHHPSVMEFHHVDKASKKKALIANNWTGGKKGQETRREADKCAMLCANCHRYEHVENDKGSTLFPYAYCTPDGSTPVINSRRRT